IDNVRGIPLISVVMEKLKKMERYEDATLAGAEERAKMPFIITHEASSTGENPLAGSRLAQASGFSKTAPPDANGNEVARQVSISVERTVHNMPIGSDMKAVDSKQSDQFKDFFTTNADLVCASVSIPPNVAF